MKLIRTLCFLVPLFLFQFCNREKTPGTKVIDLRCNNLENPCGTSGTPVFSWTLLSGAEGTGQSAYQIILDPDPESLRSEAGCLWDSGKTAFNGSAFVTYTGPDLKPATKYHWKVRIWEPGNSPSEWSLPANFITGLFGKSDWGGAEWIGFEEIPDSLILVPGVHGNGNNLGYKALKRTTIPYFRKEFQVKKKISRAVVFVSGLGHYELYLNGRRIGDRFLSPGWTNYLKTCYYNSFDVTGNIKRGDNAVGAIVGNGFYNINRERYRKLVIAYGAPKMILSLIITFTDGTVETVVSDGTWRTIPSPVTFSSIYGGEDHDARLEQPGWAEPRFNDTEWNKVLIVKEPAGSLRPETDHPVKVMQEFSPAVIIPVNDTTYVYDYRQNASGIIRLKIKGQRGQVVRLYPGELIDAGSLVTQRASGSPYLFTYTIKGESEEIWSPRFTYYGFRYVQAEGAVPVGNPNPAKLPVITDLRLLHTRNSSPASGSFKCSGELFNRIYELINWSIRSNLASVATDCPHREKLGWLEQTHLMGNSIKYVYDIHNLYNKIIDDMIEAQLENGLVPDIAPEYVPFNGGFRDSPEWGSTCIILPWDLYEWYGDIEAVRRAYPMMMKYVQYLRDMSEDHILSHGLGDWYDLGPKFPGEAQLTPKALTATSIYYYDVKLLSEMAALVGQKEDAVTLKNLAEEIRQAFNRRFFDPKTNVYSTGSQTAYSMPLFFGMVDDSIKTEVVANLVSSIVRNNNALTAGDVGYRYLLRVLEQEGHSQLIFDMNSRTDVPGYGYQLSKGATSLTESWAGLRDVSNNHMMLGHLMEWFYSGIGGIRQMPGSKAYDHILIAPETAGDLTWAESTYKSVHGEILSAWKIYGDSLSLHIRIPPDCRATVRIPQSDPDKITGNGLPLRSSGFIKVTGSVSGTTLCEVLPGEYLFRTIKVPKN